MKKRLAMLCSVLIAAAMIFSACAVQESQDTSTAGASSETASDSGTASDTESVIIAEINGESIDKEEFITYLEKMGYGSDILDDETYASTVSSILDAFVNDKVLRLALEDKGYMDLTEEQEAQALQEAQDEINYYIDYYYKDTIEAELGDDYTDEEYDAKMAEYEDSLLTGAGVTKDEFIEMQQLTIAQEAAFADLVGDVTPSEDEIKAQYDDYVASDEETMTADPTQYISNYFYGMTSYYVPEGVRRVRQVLIALDEDTQSAISTLRDAGYDEQADVLLQNGLDQIKEHAQEVLDLLDSGSVTFDEAIEQYNEDPGMDADGYPVVEGTMDYAGAFTETALSLKKVGDISGLAVSDYGYHIIEYTSDEEEGPVAYNDVKEGISDELSQTVLNDAWEQLMNDWMTEYNVVINYDNL